MKTKNPYELKEQIYKLGNREQYFNAGTNVQYSMMFYAAASEQFTARDVAVMIGICSLSADISKVEKQIEDIWTEIEVREAEREAEEKAEQSFMVQLVSAGGVRHDHLTGLTEREAIDYCEAYNYEYCDENRFVWSLDIVEE